MRKIVSICLAVVFALAGGLSHAETPLVAGTISRHPPGENTQTHSWLGGRPLADILTPDEAGALDLRGADLREADLSGMTDALLLANFDTDTLWPEVLPDGFDPSRLMAYGRDPGLGVRALHEAGITGKGVGIAIIDQTLLVEHEEYADRLRLYAEYGSMTRSGASMHGAAVASIALGKTCGVAPGALLYFIAADSGAPADNEAGWTRDCTPFAQCIDRLIALNETLPEEEKIRVISMSIGWMPEHLGVAEIRAAMQRAEEAGIAAIAVGRGGASSFMGMGRDPLVDPNEQQNVRPGLFRMESFLAHGAESTSTIFLPMDYRATAAPNGADAYAYYVQGGESWVVPYIAGLYALACQVRPDVTMVEFVQAAKDTAYPIYTDRAGETVQMGLGCDPAALIALLAQTE